MVAGSIKPSIINIEYNYRAWDYRRGRSREELAVAGLLWDLYDGRQPEDQDNVDLSIDALWSTLVPAEKNRPQITNIHELYQVLKKCS